MLSTGSTQPRLQLPVPSANRHVQYRYQRSFVTGARGARITHPFYQPEHNYVTVEREALAVKWAVRDVVLLPVQ